MICGTSRSIPTRLFCVRPVLQDETVLREVCFGGISGGGRIWCFVEEGERILLSSGGSALMSSSESRERESQGGAGGSRLAREQLADSSGGES